MHSSQYVAEDDLELLVLLLLSYECHGNMYVTTFSLSCAGIKPKASCMLDPHSPHTELHPQAPYLQITVLLIQGKVSLMVESRELKIKGSNAQWKAGCCRSGNGVWMLTLPSLRGLDSETITQSLRLSDREVRRHSNTAIQQYGLLWQLHEMSVKHSAYGLLSTVCSAVVTSLQSAMQRDCCCSCHQTLQITMGSRPGIYSVSFHLGIRRALITCIGAEVIPSSAERK